MVESRQEEVLAIVGIFAAFAFIFIAVRVYSRYLGRNFGWDDHLIILSAVFFFAQTLTIWKCMFTSTTISVCDKSDRKQLFFLAAPAIMFGIYQRNRSTSRSQL